MAETHEARKARYARERAEKLAANASRARGAAHTPEANAKRKATMQAKAAAGWVPGKGWPDGAKPNGAGAREIPLDLIPDRPPVNNKRGPHRKQQQRAADDDASENQLMLELVRLVATRLAARK